MLPALQQCWVSKGTAFCRLLLERLLAVCRHTACQQTQGRALRDQQAAVPCLIRHSVSQFPAAEGVGGGGEGGASTRQQAGGWNLAQPPVPYHLNQQQQQQLLSWHLNPACKPLNQAVPEYSAARRLEAHQLLDTSRWLLLLCAVLCVLQGQHTLGSSGLQWT